MLTLTKVSASTEGKTRTVQYVAAGMFGNVGVGVPATITSDGRKWRAEIGAYNYKKEAGTQKEALAALEQYAAGVKNTPARTKFANILSAAQWEVDYIEDRVQRYIDGLVKGATDSFADAIKNPGYANAERLAARGREIRQAGIVKSFVDYYYRRAAELMETTSELAAACKLQAWDETFEQLERKATELARGAVREMRMYQIEEAACWEGVRHDLEWKIGVGGRTLGTLRDAHAALKACGPQNA